MMELATAQTDKMNKTPCATVGYCDPGRLLNTGITLSATVDGFIFMDTNFRGLNKNDTFVGFKIRGNCIFFHNSYRKL